MIYHLFEYLQSQGVDFPGIHLLNYISVRAILVILVSLVCALVIAPKIIARLQKKQIGEEIRGLGLEGQMAKKGTPTMGGIIILASILIPVLLFGDLSNVYIWLLIITTVGMGAIGFLDDSIKVFKKDKNGLRGKYKIFGQVGIGLIVALTLCLSPQVKIRTGRTQSSEVKSTITTIPFVKNHQIDYSWIIPGDGPVHDHCGWIFYAAVIIFIITAVSNGTNLTDGLDGLAAGTSAIVGTTIGILAYLSGNAIYASYLGTLFIPHSSEVVIFMAAFTGALVGFLWFNTLPAQVFMGDTGSLALGGIIAVAAIIIRVELLVPILCGIFFVESLSVIFQTSYFKYTRKKYGEGRRIFKMSPLHHHFQKEGIPALIQKPVKAIPEAKIVVRFWIITILLCILAIITLKIR